MSKRIDVAVGVIFNEQANSVLLAKRKSEQHLGGYWEFPGGKIHSGEDIRTALERELAEELDIKVNQADFFTEIKHDYPEKKVNLKVWTVTSWSGQAIGKEEQEIKWVPLSELKFYRFPPANQNIVSRLLLPKICLISRSRYEKGESLIPVLNDCLQNGLGMFLLRLEEADKKLLTRIINNIHSLEVETKPLIILNGKPEDIMLYDIDGVHLKSSLLKHYPERPVEEHVFLGASCHNEKELEQALKLNVDYVFLSPVRKTLSHPEQTPLGWQRFSSLVTNYSLPVYALGGLAPRDIEKAKNHGAHGVAMIEAIWNANKPGEMIKEYV